MDYFNGNTNEDFVNLFLEVLHCRMELTQYTYPYEEFDPNDVIDEHISRSQSILIEIIYHSISNALFENKVSLNKDEIDALYQKKNQELTPVLNDHIENYYKTVKVDYIDLRKESEN